MDDELINQHESVTTVLSTQPVLSKSIITVKDLTEIDPKEILSAFGDGAQLTTIDYTVILCYFVGIISIGLWSSRKSQSSSLSGFFLASRSMHWVPVGASLFASNIGSGHFIGLAGAGAHSGISVSAFELNAMYICLLLGWVFVPLYTVSGISTMPEYLNKRFGGQRIRVYLSLLSLVLYIFTKVSADLYSGAIFIKQSLNYDLYTSVGIIICISAIFTIVGGLNAVIWTDFAQSVLMIAGSFLLFVLSFNKVGGYSSLMEQFALKSHPTDSQFVSFQCVKGNNSNVTCVSCSQVSPYYNHLFRPATDHEMPWPGALFGLTILGVWYWCFDQVIVQRVLSARNVTHAKAGCSLASLLKISSIFFIVLPGMAARVLWPNELGCSNPSACKKICGSESGCSSIAYPLLVLRLMPEGATGLMLSVMMAALVSSLTSIFNSASTIFTIDVYTRIRTRPSEIEQVVVGRIFVLALVTISVLWIPVIEASAGSHFFHYIQSITSYLAPPVCAVYLLAVFWPRVNECGAFWGLMVGLFVGLCRFFAEFFTITLPCGMENDDDNLKPSFVSKVHYLHFTIVLFAITCVITSLISLLTSPIDSKHLHRLTYWTQQSTEPCVDWSEVSLKKKRSKLSVSIIEPNNNNTQANDIEVQAEPSSREDSGAMPTYKKVLYALCCISWNTPQMAPDDVELRNNEEQKSEPEKPESHWEPWVNLSAVGVVALASFLYGLLA